MTDDLQVHILGAGCSVCGGYPLAREVAECMREFALGLTPDSENIKKCVNETLRLMEIHDVETIDQLAQAKGQIGWQPLNRAKIAMSAHFLSLEKAGADKAYSRYAAYFDELFSYGSSRSLNMKLESTPCRVLTFNYDRLFERTFLRWAKRYDPQHDMLEGRSLYKLLNSGLNDAEEIRIDYERFGFLKLHGGVGQTFRDNGDPLCYPYWPLLEKDIPEMSDSNFYSRKNYHGDAPLIVFPREKRDVLHDEAAAKAPFSRYTSQVWKAAQRFCEEAIEIRLIGYSMQFVDQAHFKEHLIKPATKCQRIVVENIPDAHAELKRKLTALRRELGRSWDIEFDDSRF